MRKGEIACYKQFLLFSNCFPQLYIFSASKCGNGLTLQKQNFRPVQIGSTVFVGDIINVTLKMKFCLPFPKQQILDSSKLIEFAEDNFKFD